MAIFGISFFIKEINGPFNFMLNIRRWLINNKYIGVFMYELLSCYFCVGAYSGIIVYLIHSHFSHLNIFDLSLWVFGGSIISLMGNLVVEKLTEIINVK